MNKAEEFIFNKEREVETLFKHWHIEKLAFVMQEYADEQFESRVNAVSEEKLLDTYIRKEMTQDECVGFSDGMEEFKNELLKQ